MIFFDASSVWGIMTAVALLCGLSAPPALIAQTGLGSEQLLSCVSCDISGTDLEDVWQVLSEPVDGFTLSLEWTLFNPKHGHCLEAVTIDQLMKTANEPQSSVVAAPQESPVCTDFSRDVTSSLSTDPPHNDALTESSVSVLLATGSLESHSPLPGHSTKLYTLELEATSLSGFSTTGLYSLMALYLTEWASVEALSCICVSLVYGSLVCPILYLLWKQSRANGRWTKKLATLNGANVSMKFQLFALTCEKNALMTALSDSDTKNISMESRLSLLTCEKNAISMKFSDADGKNALLKSQISSLISEKNALMAKLSGANIHLQELPVLEEKLRMAEAQLERERWEWSKAKQQQLADHSKELTRLNQELDATKRSLSNHQLDEVIALQKQASTEKQLDRERKEWRDVREQMIVEHAKLTAVLRQELLDLKEKLKATESALNKFNVWNEDSGVWETLLD